MTIFERLNRGRPPTEAAIEQPHKNAGPQLLLDFLQRWREPTISMRDIRNFGPNLAHYTMKDPKNAREAAAVLVRHRWLIPTKSPNGTGDRWEIVRKPIAHPKMVDA